MITEGQALILFVKKTHEDIVSSLRSKFFSNVRVLAPGVQKGFFYQAEKSSYLLVVLYMVAL